MADASVATARGLAPAPESVDRGRPEAPPGRPSTGSAAVPLGPAPPPGSPAGPVRIAGIPPDVEIVPGFDADGRPTGMVYARADIMCPEKSGVYGQSGQLFLTKAGGGGETLYAATVRSRGKKSWPLALDYSASGMSDAGESELDTALREAHEELGVVLDPATCARIASWVPRDGFWSRGAVFAAGWPAESAVPFNPDDVEEVRWMTAGELAAAARGGAPMKSDLRNYLTSRLWPPGGQ